MLQSLCVCPREDVYVAVSYGRQILLACLNVQHLQRLSVLEEQIVGLCSAISRLIQRPSRMQWPRVEEA